MLTTTQFYTYTSPGRLLSSSPPLCSNFTINPACLKALSISTFKGSWRILTPISPVHLHAWSPFRTISWNQELEHLVLFVLISNPKRMRSATSQSFEVRFQFFHDCGRAVTQVCVGPELAINGKRFLSGNDFNTFS